MSQAPLSPNLTKKFPKKVSQMANRNLPIGMLKGGLSVNLNHLNHLKMIVHIAVSSLLICFIPHVSF